MVVFLKKVVVVFISWPLRDFIFYKNIFLSVDLGVLCGSNLLFVFPSSSLRENK